MKAPSFWWKEKPTFIARLLWPAGLIYGSITTQRMKSRGISAKNQKVICIGNFTAGGAGKTPVAIAIAHLLQNSQRSVCFLSRGYGGSASIPLLVNPKIHEAAQVGDEPLLLARVAPTVVSKNRVEGLQLCAATDANIIIMDDGLQNPSIQKNISIAVIDAETGIGNGLCIPAGPLRAPVDQQLDHIRIVIFLGEGEQSALKNKLKARSIPFFTANLEAPSHVLSNLRDKALLAYCGIGRPEKFFSYLEKLGGHVAKKRSFSDHHAYIPDEAKQLLDEAQQDHLTLITTEKDFVRLSKTNTHLGILAARSRVLPVEAIFKEPEKLLSLLF